MTAELERNPLWLILVETVHTLPMYPSHKAYVRDKLTIESPDISAEELSLRLDKFFCRANDRGREERGRTRNNTGAAQRAINYDRMAIDAFH